MNNKAFLVCKSVVFRQWGNKKFSVFQSLKKCIRIAFLPLAYVLVFSSPALSQTDTIKLEEIIINTTRIPALYPEIARIVNVIQNDDVEKNTAKSLDELLEVSANVDVRQRGVFGTQADVSIRGGSFDQTLILINGIKINDPQTGHYSLNLPIDLESVERIEILEGSGARIYGPNAFAGAINFITSESKTDNISVNLNAGQYNSFSGTLSTSFSFDNFSNYLSVSKKVSDGYISNTDFDIENIYYQANIDVSKINISAFAGLCDKKFGANCFYTPKFPDQYEILNTLFAGVKAETGRIFKVTSSFYWRRNQDVFQLFRETDNWYSFDGRYFINGSDTAKYYQGIYQNWNYYSGHNYHLTNVLGSEINSNFKTKFGKTALGVEFRSEKIQSNKLGEKIDSIDIPFALNQYFTYGHQRQNFSAFIDHLFTISKFGISTGILINYNSDFNWNYYSGLDLSFSFNDKLRAIASVNQSMRMPTFTDLYYQSATNIGNPDLKPEKAITYETGLKYLTSFLIADFSVFRRDGKDIIDWVKQANEDKWQSLNYTSLITYGAGLNAKINLNEVFSEKFFIKNMKFSYAYIYSDKPANQYISNYALDYLTHNSSCSVFHTIFSKLAASWSFSYQSRNGTFSKYNPETAQTSEQNYKPVYLLNGKIFWTDKFYEIYVSATNILNRSYYDLGNIQMPGIWITGGVKVNFTFKED